MHSVKFLSPNLKFNNNKVYYLQFNELNNNNYKENNYFLSLDDIKIEDSLLFNNINIFYKLIFTEFDDNIMIELTYDDNVDKKTILKYVYYIQEKIKKIKNENIDEYHTKYENEFMKYENNILLEC